MIRQRRRVDWVERTGREKKEGKKLKRSNNEKSMRQRGKTIFL